MAVVTFDDIESVQPQGKGGVVTFDDIPDDMNIIEKIGASPLGNAVGGVIDKTGQIIKNIPNANPASSGIQLIGQGANMVAAPISAGLSAITPDAVKQAIGSGVSSVNDYLGNAVNSFADTPAGRSIGDYLVNSPRTQANMQEALDTAKGAASALTVIPAGKLATSGVAMASPKVVGAVNKFETMAAGAPGVLGDVKSGVSTNAALGNVPSVIEGTIDSAKNMAKVGVSSTDDLGKAASYFYKAAEDTGALLKPEAIQQAAAAIKAKVLKSTPEGQIFGGNSVVDDYLARLDKISSMPVSLRGLDEIDSSLQDAISTASRAGDKAAVGSLKEIRNGLRNASSTANQSDIVNPQAFQNWRDGDKLYAARMKSKQVDDIVKNAYNQQVPSTGIKTGFSQLAKSIDKYGNQGWTPEEVFAIRKAAKSGVVGGALSTIGGRLMSGIAGTAAGAAVGGVLGAPVGLVVGEAAGFPLRAGADAIQAARATQVQRLIGQRPEIAALMDKAKAEALFNARKAASTP